MGTCGCKLCSGRGQAPVAALGSDNIYLSGCFDGGKKAEYGEDVLVQSAGVVYGEVIPEGCR